MAFHLSPFLEGLATALAFHTAIGPQNSFVLKQGLIRNHVFVLALICTLIDAGLIVAGMQGLGLLFKENALLLAWAKWGGAAFLFYYGFRSFRAVFKKQTLQMEAGVHKPSLKASVLTILALSLLNPHVYLDTVVLLGSIGAQFPIGERYDFMVGAIIASCVWFFSLGYGAKLLTPLFKNPLSWKILDFIIGVVMWGIAVALVKGQ